MNRRCCRLFSKDGQPPTHPSPQLQQQQATPPHSPPCRPANHTPTAIPSPPPPNTRPAPNTHSHVSLLQLLWQHHVEQQHLPCSSSPLLTAHALSTGARCACTHTPTAGNAPMQVTCSASAGGGVLGASLRVTVQPGCSTVTDQCSHSAYTPASMMLESDCQIYATCSDLLGFCAMLCASCFRLLLGLVCHTFVTCTTPSACNNHRNTKPSSNNPCSFS
jgi:hypothetical protein